MTTKRFLKKKNKIVKRVTGLLLVPKDQIVDRPNVLLNNDSKGLVLSSDVCPYCVDRYTSTMIECSDCPMALAGNSCQGNPDSTWYKANTLWKASVTEEDRDELIKLIKKYNRTCIKTQKKREEVLMDHIDVRSIIKSDRIFKEI